MSVLELPPPPPLSLVFPPLFKLSFPTCATTVQNYHTFSPLSLVRSRKYSLLSLSTLVSKIYSNVCVVMTDAFFIVATALNIFLTEPTYVTLVYK